VCAAQHADTHAAVTAAITLSLYNYIVDGLWSKDTSHTAGLQVAGEHSGVPGSEYWRYAADTGLDKHNWALNHPLDEVCDKATRIIWLMSSQHVAYRLRHRA
jgi:hypothetical protein